MAADFVGTFFFQDLPSSYGWTEVFYTNAADIAAARTRFQEYIPLRAAVLTDLHKMVACRISQVDILNDSLLVQGFPIVGDVTATTLSQCEPWTALLTRNEAGSEHRGRTYFHGLLESTFTTGRIYDPVNAQSVEWEALLEWIRVNCRLRWLDGVTYMYTPFTDIYPLRQVNRKVGRPFSLLRGRRKIPA